MKRNIGAVVLAAGKGRRMNSKKINKVALPLGEKPMIVHSVDLLKSLKVSPIVIVVGYAKDSVMKLFGKDVIFAEQLKRLGTGHALSRAVGVIPDYVSDVIVFNGDDSAFYTRGIVSDLIRVHEKKRNAITLLTLEVNDPFGLGRIIRNDHGKIESIVEEKDATVDQKKIKEINPACYIFSLTFLKKYLHRIKKSSITGEYYIVSLVEIAIKNNEKISTVNAGSIPWRGVNTGDELKKAEDLFLKLRKIKK